MLKSTYTLIKT